MRKRHENFNHERLTQARVYHGLTKKVCAEVADVAPATMSRYESGKTTPSVEVVEKLASFLDVSVRFFEGDAAQPGVVHYRKYSDVKKKRTDSHAISVAWTGDVLDYVRRFAELPPVELPRVDVDPTLEIEECADLVEEAADETRATFGIRRGPVDNLTWYVESLGVIVISRPLGSGRTDGFSSWVGDRPIAVIESERFSGPRVRLSLAHELGHLVLHRNVSEEDLRDRETYKRVESQAFRFAGALLFPQEEFPDVRNWSLGDFLQLKPKWGMSVAAMVRRAHDLEIIGPSRYKSLYIDISRRGWRKKEPFDQEFPDEEPTLLCEVVEAIMDQFGIGRRQFVQELALPTQELEQIIGFPEDFLTKNEARFSLKESP